MTGQLLGGWQISWILDYEAGQPLCGCNQGQIQENGDPYPGKSTSGPNVVLRPNRNPGVALSTASYNKAKDYFTGKASVAQIFNPAGFSVTSSQYVLGNAIRNYSQLKGPALYNENATILKSFYFGERFTGILRVDYFNLFNRTQFYPRMRNVSMPLGERLIRPAFGAVAIKNIICPAINSLISGVRPSYHLDIDLSSRYSARCDYPSNLL